ncbi:MAG: NRDE family protein [Sphingobacteriales bacterium]|nr:NRDE family protein [Sphingobacteriales bacterium]
MCTVLFIPQKDSVIFTSLRDENPERPATAGPALLSGENWSFIAPLDRRAGGTWAGINNYGNVVILLNGAFENHRKETAYKKSRGLIVTALLKSVYPVVEWSLMDMQGVEPYTLVVWSEQNLFQLVWDGENKHRTHFDTGSARIWSSATLYSPAAKNYRQELFENWMNTQPGISRESIFSFFSSVTDPENGFIINRGARLKTLSYSFIELGPGQQGLLSYQDLRSGNRQTKVLPLEHFIPDLNNLYFPSTPPDHAG